MTKHFVLRPHALLSSYDSLHKFGEDNVVVIPMAVIDEINAMRNDLTPEKAKIRKAVLKYIQSLMDKGVTSEEGYKQQVGGIIKVVSNYTEVELNVHNISEYQKRTLQVCKGLKQEGKEVTLVTNNIGLQIKANMEGIKAEEFKDEIFPVLEKQYTGRIRVNITEEVHKKMYSEHEILIKDIPELESQVVLENCYIIMDYGSLVYYAQVKGDKIIEINSHLNEPFGIKPMNEGQIIAINAFYDETPLVVVKGAAGTGKTLLSLGVAIDRVINDKEFNQILVTRSVSNEKLGYLPGTVEEKLSPFLQGVNDNLDMLINQGTKSKKMKKMISESAKCKGKLEKNKNRYDPENEDDKPEENEHGQYFFERNIIKVQALEMLRGRSIINTLFIIDETQNIEPEFIKTIVTRAAKGSKFIFLGDPTQIDNPKLSEKYNGLVYLAEKLKGDPDCTVVTLNEEESVRSRLARVASKIL